MAKVGYKGKWIRTGRLIAKAIAIVRGVKAVYEGTGVQACPRLVTDALEWALGILEPASCVRLENGLPDPRRFLAKIDAENLLKTLPLLRTDVNANIGFGRG